MLSRTVQLFSRKQTLSVVTCLPCDTESFLTCAPNGCDGQISKDSASRTLCSPKLHPYISSVKIPFTFPRAGTLFTRSPGCSLDPISFGLSQRLTYHMQTRSFWSASNCVKRSLVLRHPFCKFRNTHLRNYHNNRRCVLHPCRWAVHDSFQNRNVATLNYVFFCRNYCDKSETNRGEGDISQSQSDDSLKLSKVETAEVKEWLQEIREDFKTGGAKIILTGESSDTKNIPPKSDDSGGSSSTSGSSSEYDSSSDSELEDRVIQEVLDHAEFYSEDGHEVTKDRKISKKLPTTDVDGQSKLYAEVSEYAEKISTSDSAGDLEEAEDLTIDIEEFSDYESDWEEEKPTYVPPIPLTRGTEGVFDLDDLVTLLHEEKVKDLCVICVPPSLHYVDYLILVTAMSKRHITALTETVHWIYKRKKSSSDPTIHIEKGHNWTALDLGNIALHILMPEVREEYDIETLWTCGSEYDEKSREINTDPYALPVPPSRKYATNETKDVSKD